MILTLMTHTFHSKKDSENNFICSNGKTFSHNKKSLRPIDLDILAHFQTLGSLPTAHILNNFIILFSTKLRDLAVGTLVHPSIIRSSNSNAIYAVLLLMHTKCGEIQGTQQLFHEMPQKNAVTNHSLILGYLHFKCRGILIYSFLEAVQEV